MAVPYVVTVVDPGPASRTQKPLPPEAQPGDLILLVVRSTIPRSDQSGRNGSHGHDNISGATGSLGVVAESAGGWMEQKPNMWSGYIYRGIRSRTRVRAATVPEDPSTVGLFYREGKLDNVLARVVILRNAAGVGSSNRYQWRVPTNGDQSLGFFAGGGLGTNTIPAGVTDINVGSPLALFTAPSNGPHAGPGGAIDRSGDRSTAHLLGLEIVGTSGPGEPVITEPVDGSQVANGVPVEVAWAHQPARPGGHQGAYRLMVTTMPEDPDDDPVVRWWDGLGLVASETTVESGTSRVELPPSVIGQDATLSVQVATQEALDGEWSLYSAASSFSSVEPPTVTVTGPTGPVHNTMRPVIEWDGQAAPGEVLVQFHARIANSDGVFVFDSGGQQGSPGVFAAPALSNWVNGAEYVPWVRVRQTGGAWSAWESGESFEVTWTEPATPTVSAAPGRHGVEITITDPTIDQARQNLLDALAAYTSAPVEWSTTEPGDTSVVWADPDTGQARRWSAGVGGSVDDVVTRRNLAINPSFETGTHGVLTGNGVTDLVAASSGTWSWQGSQALRFSVADAPSRPSTVVRQEVSLPAGADYFALSARVSRGSGGNIAAIATAQFSVGGAWQAARFSGDFIDLRWDYLTVPETTFAATFPVPAGAEAVWTGFYFSGDEGGVGDWTQPGDALVWSDGWIPAVADTEAEALAAVADYFDGDTPERRADNIIYRYAWEDEPHASPSTETALGRGWYEIVDPDVVAAGQAYEQAVGGAELAAEVQRADGDDWVPVALAAQGGTAADVLAPYSQQVTYRARTTATIADVTVYSDWAHSGPTVNTDRYAYLADANDPARWVRLALAQAVPHEHPRQVETAHGLGDRVPMVNKGPELAQTGTMTVRTTTRDEEDRLIALLQETPRLVLRRPAEQRYAGNTPWHDQGTTVLTVNTGIDVEPIADNYPLTLRRVTFGWVEQ